jgi:hypothetical protein
MAACGGPGGDWIAYPEAQERIHAGLPVEVLDPLDPEWRIERFTAPVQHRHYRIPGADGPINVVAGQVKTGDVVRVFTATGTLIDVVDVPPGTWRLVFRKEA